MRWLNKAMICLPVWSHQDDSYIKYFKCKKAAVGILLYTDGWLCLLPSLGWIRMSWRHSTLAQEKRTLEFPEIIYHQIIFYHWFIVTIYHSTPNSAKIINNIQCSLKTFVIITPLIFQPRIWVLDKSYSPLDNIHSLLPFHQNNQPTNHQTKAQNVS